MRGEFLDLNGARIYYYAAGTRGAGEPVILIHGFMANNENQWVKPDIVKALVGKGYRVIALDSRGHGRSGKPEGSDKYGKEMSEDVARLMDKLGIDKAHIVTYSMGSWIGQRLAVDHPKKVASLVVGGYWYARNTVEQVRINSPTYERIATQKDFIAELLPPPLNVVRSMLLYASACTVRSVLPLERPLSASPVGSLTLPVRSRPKRVARS